MTNQFCHVAACILAVVIVIFWVIFTIEEIYSMCEDIILVRKQKDKYILDKIFKNAVISGYLLVALYAFAKLAYMLITIEV